MRKSLTICCAALLATGLVACKKGGGNSDEDRLNAAAAQLDNNVYDTSADDATLNQLPADEAGAGNGRLSCKRRISTSTAWIPLETCDLWTSATSGFICTVAALAWL